MAWASGAGGGGAGGGGSSSCRLYRFFEVELHTQVQVVELGSGWMGMRGVLVTLAYRVGAVFACCPR